MVLSWFPPYHREQSEEMEKPASVGPPGFTGKGSRAATTFQDWKTRRETTPGPDPACDFNAAAESAGKAVGDRQPQADAGDPATACLRRPEEAVEQERQL